MPWIIRRCFRNAVYVENNGVFSHRGHLNCIGIHLFTLHCDTWKCEYRIAKMQIIAIKLEIDTYRWRFFRLHLPIDWLWHFSGIFRRKKCIFRGNFRVDRDCWWSRVNYFIGISRFNEMSLMSAIHSHQPWCVPRVWIPLFSGMKLHKINLLFWFTQN